MAHPVSASHGLFTSAVEGFFDLIKDIRAAYVFQRDVRRTMKELSKLTDRELNDIGLSRGDIYAVAHGDVTLRRVKEQAETNPNLKGWI